MSPTDDTARRGRTDAPDFRDINDAVDRLEDKVDTRFELHEQRVDKTFATKSDVRLWVIGGLVGGQSVAAAVTAFVTHINPASQAALLYARLKGML